ncbi:MAG: filamentous hemagglutinin family protein, partial [Chthoniobacterales bacterium]
ALGTAGLADYEAGFDAIKTLFPGVTADGKAATGDLTTRARDIRTKNGGEINILVPGGELTLAKSVIGVPLAPPGIITEGGGSISIFAKEDVDIGIGRIFTLRGGDEVIWSSDGDIAAGASSKTVKSAPPTRVLIDPQSGDVQTDLAGLSTGGGIGVLATVAGVEPGNVDLVAPNGIVDAGDAGIRASGQVSIAATAVLNADNINAPGGILGVPTAPVVAAPNIAGLTAASNVAGAANSAAESVADQARQQPQPDETPSTVTVDVLGYGGGDSPSL